jgi:hypothetical protein
VVRKHRGTGNSCKETGGEGVQNVQVTGNSGKGTGC